MKYTLHVNQIAAHGIGIQDKVDLIDLCLFDAFKSFANSARCEKFIDDNGIWFWISYAEIIREIPLANIKTKDGIYRRMLKLRDAGLILFHPNNQKAAKTFFQWGRNYDAMERTDWADQPTDKKPKVVKDLRMKNRTPYGQKTVPPTDEKPNNQDTINQTTKTNNNAAEFLIKSTTEIPGVTMAEKVKVEAEKEKIPPNSAPPPKKENAWQAFDIDTAAALLKEDYTAAERFARDLSCSLQIAKERLGPAIDEFVFDQKTVCNAYPNDREFRKHFFNWLPAKVKAKLAAKGTNHPTQQNSPVPTNIRRL